MPPLANVAVRSWNIGVTQGEVDRRLRAKQMLPGLQEAGQADILCIQEAGHWDIPVTEEPMQLAVCVVMAVKLQGLLPAVCVVTAVELQGLLPALIVSRTARAHRAWYSVSATPGISRSYWCIASLLSS